MNPKVSSTRAAGARSPKRRYYGRRRRGYVLVLVVMLIFGLMGLAALVIDIGFARLAQSEMQTAVDSAALEGLRNGRQQASQIVDEMFSDSTDSSGQTVQYGAGPVVDFSGGVGDPDLAAAQLMQPGNRPVYQPMTSSGTAGLELNPSNATEGDMASGTYGVNSNYDPTLTADEDANYNRRDFVPSAGTAAAANSAFLVRMRRSNNYNGLDQEAGISSAGPPLPMLFGRGSMMARSGANNQLSVESGITVRATAIATAGPVPLGTSGGTYTAGLVKMVGQPHAAYSMPGSLSATGSLSGSLSASGSQLYYVVMNLSTWNGFSVTLSTTANADGTLTSANGTAGYVADGSAVDPNDVSPAYPEGRPLLGATATIGDLAQQIAVSPSVFAGQLASELSPTGVAFVPIVDDSPSSPIVGRVIGFGTVSVAINGTTIVFSKGGLNAVTPANASASLGVPLPAIFSNAASGPALATQLFNEHTNDINNPMLAPVLVDHYIGPNTP